MRIATGLLVGVLTFLAGCSQDDRAYMLLRPDTGYGRVNEAIAGSGEGMVGRKTITAARQYTMPDGVILDTWVIAAPAGVEHKGTVLVLHGLCDSKITYLRMARTLSPKGYDFVLVDLRTHGRSGGQIFTYGAIEKHDLKGLMDKVYEEKLASGPLFVLGTDVGGSIAIQFAAIDSRVAGVVAVGTPKDLESAARRINPMASEAEVRQITAAAGKKGNFDPDAVSALCAIAQVRCPVMLYHGLLDLAVPYADSEALLAAAGGPKRLEPLPMASRMGVTFLSDNTVVDALERLHTGRMELTTQPAATSAPAAKP